MADSGQVFVLYFVDSLNIGKYSEFMKVSNNVFRDYSLVDRDGSRISASVLFSSRKADVCYVLISGNDYDMQAERLSGEFGFVLGKKRKVKSLRALDRILS